MSGSTPFVITVSGVSGSGKSSTAKAAARLLGDASCLHFDDYGELMQQPEDGLKWIADGADLTAFLLPEFGRDLRLLREGNSVITPTGRVVSTAQFLVLEEPFGRGRTDMEGLVDLSVCIDLPLEIALARRLLDVVERWEGPAEKRFQWIGEYLNTYLFQGMREVYAAINERVKADSDLVLDGTQPVDENAQKVVDAVLIRRSS